MIAMVDHKSITQDKKEVIRNLYLSGIAEEFNAMQLNLEITCCDRCIEGTGRVQLRNLFLFSNHWLVMVAADLILFSRIAFSFP